MSGSDLSRRELLARGAAGLGVLSGVGLVLSACGSSQRASNLPGVGWPNDDLRPAPRATPVRPSPVPPAPGVDVPGGVIARSEWARGQPIPARMTPARPYWRITLHHDGMGAFTTTDRAAAAARLEQIRHSHLHRRGEPFGDIGYHYLIDPAGRVWQGRPLNWQGAHVARTNEGNLGICCLGNFMVQRPTEAQLAALDQFVASQMRQYRIPVNHVYTHRELGKTECPGDNLQPYINDARRSGPLARA
jgi:hypothetical protein